MYVRKNLCTERISPARLGKDPVHLTGDGYTKLANGIMDMAEGGDANFSGGKRGLEVENDRPVPTIGGRKAWIYSTGQGRGSGRGGRGGGPERGSGEAAGRGPATGKDSGSGGYYAGGYSGKKR
jgi:hypothetical protein